MSSLTEKEITILKSIFHDLQLLFERDEIKSDKIAEVLDQVESEEATSYINSLKEAKPETALSDAFFAGRSILKKYLFETATPEAIVGDGFIDFKVKIREKIILVELKPLFESKTRKVKAGKELVSLKQLKLKPKNHKKQILKYIHEGGEYIILTNLKEWFFFNKSVTAAEFEPFASTDLMEFHKEFEVERNLWDYLTRLDRQSIREDLDARFFKSLQMWVEKLSEIEFNVDEQRKTEVIINLINKFIFIQTLDDYRVIEPRWIQETWGHSERRWANKGKAKVLREFFEDVDDWFYQYYDTELFRESVLDYVNQPQQNLELLHKNLKLVLGLEYWMFALGGFRGIMQYNFRYIDEDILGKAYETYLAGVRHDEGIYYTPKYVTQYIVENTVGNKLDGIVKKIKESLEKESFEEAMGLLTELTSVRVLDPACGSGSFLIKAVRKIMEKYKEVQALLKELEKKHNKWQGGLHRPKEMEEKVEKINQVMETLGPRNDRELIARILVRHIHGNDKDKKALEVAKVNMWLEAIKLSPADFRYDRLPTDTNYILPDLQMNFCNGDSVVGLPESETVQYLYKENKDEISELCELRGNYITDPSDPDLVKKIIEIKSNLRKQLDEKFKEYLAAKKLPVDVLKETIPFHWALDFWFFYFDESGKPFPADHRGAHIVIGNPPYERIQVLNKKAPIYVQYLNNAEFVSSYKNYDLAVVFIERGFRLLNRNGIFGYIVTNKFVKSDYGEALRKLLSEEKAVKTIVDFGHQQVFEKASTYTLLLFLSKDKEKNKFKWVIVKRLEATLEQLRKIRDDESFENETLVISSVPYNQITSEPWIFVLPRERPILNKLERHPRLKSITKKIFQGIRTSEDEVYILDMVEKPAGGFAKVYSKSLKKDVTLEADLLKPVLKGKETDRYASPEYKKYVLFPYNPETGEFISPNFIKTKFPKTWDYLIANKERLENRERGRMKDHQDWYAYIYPKNLTEFEARKIMTPDLAYHSEFMLDSDGTFYFTFGYGVKMKKEAEEKISYEYLLGLLNSKLLEYYLRKVSTSMRGGYYVFRRQFIEQLPIYAAPKENALSKSIEALVENIIKLKQAEQSYIDLWKYWSVKLSGNEYNLGSILENDFRNLREGNFENTWTKTVTFYPYQERDVLSKEHSSFSVTGEKERQSIKIFGVDESNKEELVYSMEFKDNSLMKHVYTAIISLLDSKAKVNRLSDILVKTIVPVITPNPLQQTSNIIKKVEKEFSEWKQHNKLTSIKEESLCEMHSISRNTEANIDALVFALYGLDKNEAKTVLESLSLPSLYQERVLSYFDEIGKLVR